MEIDLIYFVYFSACSWSWWISHSHSYQLSWQEEQSNQCQLCIQPAVRCNLFLQFQTAQGSKERLYALLQQQGNSTEPQRLATTERVMFTGETFVHWFIHFCKWRKKKVSTNISLQCGSSLFALYSDDPSAATSGRSKVGYCSWGRGTHGFFPPSRYPNPLLGAHSVLPIAVNVKLWWSRKGAWFREREEKPSGVMYQSHLCKIFLSSKFSYRWDENCECPQLSKSKENNKNVSTVHRIIEWFRLEWTLKIL